MNILITLIPLGLVVGIVSAFFGVGGGVIIVPTLYTIFSKLPPQTVIGSSLAIICLNSLINTRNFVKSGKEINKKFILSVGLPSVLGVLVASQLVLVLEPPMIKKIFGGVLCLVILRLLFSKESRDQRGDKVSDLTPQFLQKSALSGFAGGVVSGLTGLGGGAVLVPLFISYLKIPYQLISFFSNACMFFITLFGALGYLLETTVTPPGSELIMPQLQVGNVNFAVVGGVFIGAFISSRLGVKLDGLTDPKHKKWIFALLLTFMAARILLR